MDISGLVRSYATLLTSLATYVPVPKTSDADNRASSDARPATAPSTPSSGILASNAGSTMPNPANARAVIPEVAVSISSPRPQQMLLAGLRPPLASLVHAEMAAIAPHSQPVTQPQLRTQLAAVERFRSLLAGAMGTASKQAISQSGAQNIALANVSKLLNAFAALHLTGAGDLNDLASATQGIPAQGEATVEGKKPEAEASAPGLTNKAASTTKPRAGMPLQAAASPISHEETPGPAPGNANAAGTILTSEEAAKPAPGDVSITGLTANKAEWGPVPLKAAIVGLAMAGEEAAGHAPAAEARLANKETTKPAPVSTTAAAGRTLANEEAIEPAQKGAVASKPAPETAGHPVEKGSRQTLLKATEALTPEPHSVNSAARENARQENSYKDAHVPAGARLSIEDAVAVLAKVSVPAAMEAQALLGEANTARLQSMEATILNAAMIPGWPPVRPFAMPEHVGRRSLAQLQADQASIQQYLANLGIGEAIVSRIRKLQRTAIRATAVMFSLAVLLTQVVLNLRVVLDELAEIADEAISLLEEREAMRRRLKE